MTETADVVIEVRNCKDRGNLVLTIKKLDSADVFFFKYHHQTIEQHPEKIQDLVRSSKPTTRVKSLKVNIIDFITEYYDVYGSVFEFKGVKLNSTSQQKAKVFDRRINKEIGIMKRKKTIADGKAAKVEEKNRKILEQIRNDEELYQAERARRVVAAMADMEVE